MIVLDTSVVSELMRAQPDVAVLAWLDSVGDDVVVTTAITVAEIRYGIARLPEGRRRSALAVAADRTFVPLGQYILAFDSTGAFAYAEIVADRERSGSPISTTDAQIAAIVGSSAAVLATRNVRDFTGAGVEMVDPWTVGRR